MMMMNDGWEQNVFNWTKLNIKITENAIKTLLQQTDRVTVGCRASSTRQKFAVQKVLTSSVWSTPNSANIIILTVCTSVLL